MSGRSEGSRKDTHDEEISDHLADDVDIRDDAKDNRHIETDERLNVDEQGGEGDLDVGKESRDRLNRGVGRLEVDWERCQRMKKGGRGKAY